MAGDNGRLKGVFVLICTLHLIVSDDVLPVRLKCASCRGVLSPLDCNDIEICKHEDEICYIEEVIDLGGEMVINAGCRKQSTCDSVGCFKDVSSRKRDVDQDVKEVNIGEQICHHCCDTEFCNMFGCSDSRDIDTIKGSRCLVCDMIDHPSHCKVVENCGPGEYCYTSLLVQGTGGVDVTKRYNTGCMKREVCEALEAVHQQQQGMTARKKRSYVQLYSQCCKDHLCNRNLPLETESPSRSSESYKCPDRVTQTEMVFESPKPVTEVVCEDVIDECAEYGFDYICQGEYIPWAKINCNKFCKFCTPAQQCEDTIDECPLYGYDYICTDEYQEWSMLNCKKFCNLCDVATIPPEATDTTSVTTATTTTTLKTTHAAATPSQEVCEDHVDNCAEYGYNYICMDDNYKPWVKLNCRKFCGLCDYMTSLPMTTADPGCHDDIDYCAEYGYAYICTELYKPWATIHCPEFCGLCQDSTTSSTTTLEHKTTGSKTPSLTTTLDVTSQTSGTTRSPKTTTHLVPTANGTTSQIPTPAQPITYTHTDDITTTLPKANTSSESITLNETTTAQTVPITTGTSSRPIIYDAHTTGSHVSSSTLLPVSTSIMNATKHVTRTTTEATTTIKPDVSTGTNSKTTATTARTTSTDIPLTTEILTTEEAMTTERPCRDTMDCSVYSIKMVCHDDFLKWASEHCPKHCGFCIDESETTTTTTSTTSTTTTTKSTSPTTTTIATTTAPTTTPRDPNCFDVENCAGLENQCNDTEQHKWLYDNCRRTCQMCQETAPCEDEITGCADMEAMICPPGMSSNLRPFCKKTCKLC